MYLVRTCVCWWIFSIILALRAAEALAHEEVVILVGRSAAGEIKLDLDFAQPIELPASVFPGISGHATGEVALHSTILDDATNDFFQLSNAADFRFILVAKDSGVEVWNDTGSGYMGIGETFYVGAFPFDTHPVWNIVNGTQGNVYWLTLKLRDLNGVYPDSAPFALSFTPSPPPPKVSITQVDPQHATLSWTTNAANWTLQSAISLTTNWESVTNIPATAGADFSLTITLDRPQQFFRLHRE